MPFIGAVSLNDQGHPLRAKFTPVLFPILIRKPPAIFAGSIPPVMSFSGEGKW